MRLPNGMLALVLACGGCGSSGEAEPPASSTTAGSDDLATMRAVLSGDRLTDDEVRALDRVLRASGAEYTDDGLATFAEWELTAEVRRTDTGYDLYVVGGTRVAAEWHLEVNMQTGEAEVTSSSDLVEPPPPE